MISLIRVDDRLVHAQIVVGWMEFLRCRHVVVVDDEVARDADRLELFRMVVPEDVRLEALEIRQAAGRSAELEALADPVLVLFSDPISLQTSVDAGLAPRSVNLGGMHQSAGRRQWVHGLFASDSEIAAIRRMIGMGIDFEIRPVPAARRIEVPSFA